MRAIAAAATVAFAIGCSDAREGAPPSHADPPSIVQQFSEQVRAFIEEDDANALDRLWALGPQLAHPAGDAETIGLFEYHRSFPDEFGREFSDARPEFIRLMRESDYQGFVWYRYDTHPSIADEDSVVLSAWGDAEFVRQVREIVGVARASIASESRGGGT